MGHSTSKPYPQWKPFTWWRRIDADMELVRLELESNEQERVRAADMMADKLGIIYLTLAYRSKPKSKAGKKRKRKEKALAK